MAKKERMVVDTRGDDKDARNPHAIRDREVRENLKHSYGVEAEAAWRFYDHVGYMPMTSLKDKVDFNPNYVGCPAPIKIDRHGGWEPENCERCNMTPPIDKTGKEQRVWAIAHHKLRHADDWIARHSTVDEKNRNGAMRPPSSTRVEFDAWVAEGESLRDREKTDLELAIKQQEEAMEQSERQSANMKRINEEKKEKKKDLRETMVVGESESE